MTATHNPQATADQARAAYRHMTDQLGYLGLDTAVPEGVRALAEKSVARAREVYDRSFDADPPPLKWSDSKYGFRPEKDLGWQGRDTSRKRLLRSFVRLMC